METHREIYMEHLDLGPEDFAPDELLNCRGADVHHIFGREMNERMEAHGIPHPDHIWNLMFLCRLCHTFYGQKESFDSWLFDQHLLFLERNVTTIERDPFDDNLALILPIYLERIVSNTKVIVTPELTTKDFLIRDLSQKGKKF